MHNISQHLLPNSIPHISNYKQKHFSFLGEKTLSILVFKAVAFISLSQISKHSQHGTLQHLITFILLRLPDHHSMASP